MAFRRTLVACVAALVCCSSGRAASAYDALGPGAIVASVRDRDGRPLAGAVVTAVGPGERHATTTSAGIVSLVALPLGTYRVRVARAGYEGSDFEVTLAASRAFGKLDVRLERAAGGVAPASLSGTLRSVALNGNDPSLAHALVALPNLDLPGNLLGTASYETKTMLDGIPLGGPSSGSAAFRPDALALERVAVLPGPETLAPSLDGVIGGVLDLRTQPAVRTRDARAAAGYDSAFGSFQRVDAADWTGPFAASLEAVSGGGAERDRVLRTSFALSSATSLAFDSYRFDRSATSNATTLATAASEPAYSAHLATRAFGGSLDVRSYGSDYAALAANERLRGLSAGFERSVGAETLALTLDRSADAIASQFGNALAQVTSVTARAGLKLGQTGRLDLADTRSASAGWGTRNDPHVSLALPLAGALTLRASAGSAYLSAPFELVSLKPAALGLTPETSFGYRAGADLALGNGATFSLGTFELTRWNRFATLAGARSRGIAIDYARKPAQAGWGIDAGLGLAHDVAFGPVQPGSRVVQTLPAFGGDVPGVADSRAHLGFVFRGASGIQVSATALSLGPNNGVTAGTLRYAAIGASIPLLRAFALRVDGATPLGAVAPRTLSISFGAATPSH